MVFHDLPLPDIETGFEFSDDFLRFYEDSFPLIEPGLDHSVSLLFTSPIDSSSDSDPSRYHAGLDTPSPGSEPTRYHAGFDTPSPGSDPTRYHAGMVTPSPGSDPTRYHAGFDTPSPGSDPTRYHAGSDTPSPGSEPTRYHAGFDTPSSGSYPSRDHAGLETPSEVVNQDYTSPEINSYDSGSGKPAHDPVEEPNRTLSIQAERKRKRKISNRESAKRSRMRKRNELENLNKEVNRLKLENREGTSKLEMVSRQLKMAWVDNNRLRIESLYLRTRLAEFEQFWGSQNLHAYMQ